jgi:hypothetical protein
VNNDRASRIALVLPADSRPHIVAVTQVAVFLVSEVGRTEVDLLRLPAVPTSIQGARAVRVVLFVATAIRTSVQDRVASGILERLVRSQVERQYARLGIASVEYDLQML